MIELDYLTIEIKVQSETVLAIFIYSDGTINRKGDGSLNPKCPLAIGMGDTKEMFEKLNPLITDDFQSYFGRVFDDPDKKGTVCSLEIQIGTESKITGSGFTYGTDTIGPPRSVSDFVSEALAVTDEWYKRAIKNAGPAEKTNTSSLKNKFFSLENKTLVGLISLVVVFLALFYYPRISKIVKEGSAQNEFIAIGAILIVLIYAVSVIKRYLKR